MDNEKFISNIVARQEAEYNEVKDNSNRGKSANALAALALAGRSSGCRAAARLLLAMEKGHSFDFRELLRLDSTNRAHAEVIMQGYKPHHLWPSRWMDEEGFDGSAIMQEVAENWPN